MKIKPGSLVKLKKLKGGGEYLFVELWNQDTEDFSSRNHDYLPEQYPAEWAWSGNYSVMIKDTDVGIFIKRVVPKERWENPVDIVLINEKMVGIKSRRVRTRGWQGTVRYESKVKRITKRDY